MSKPNNSRDDAAAEQLMEFLGTVSKFLIMAGGIVILVGAGLMFYYIFAFAGVTDVAKEQQALGFVHLAQNLLMIALLAFGAATGFLWWQETRLTATHIGLVVLLAGAPFFVPMIQPDLKAHVQGAALQALQLNGIVFMVLAVIVMLAQAVIGVRERAEMGARADKLRQDKGIKPDRDAKNVLMGNCYQLPYCRKFVREKCPLYHARRACWREKVGCMCEEEVIRGAMEDRPIPKDALTAAKMIPYNNKISHAKKVERCKICVIYNEHQKHKYKVSVPVIIVGVIAFYAGMHGVLIAAVKAVFDKIDSVVSHVSVSGNGTNINDALDKSSIPFHEIFVAALMVLILANLLRASEWVFFKAKL